MIGELILIVELCILWTMIGHLAVDIAEGRWRQP